MPNTESKYSFTLRDLIYIVVFISGIVGNYFALDKRIDLSALEIKMVKEVLIPDIRNDFGKDLEDIKNLTQETKDLINALHTEIDQVKQARFDAFTYMNGDFDTLRYRGKTGFLYEKNIGKLVEVKEEVYGSVEVDSMVEEIKCNLIEIQDMAYLIEDKIKDDKYLAELPKLRIKGGAE